MKKFGLFQILLVAAFGIFLSGFTANAQLPLGPGATLVPAPVGPPPGGGIVAGPLVVAIGAPSFSGFLTTTVTTGDPLNPFGPAGLDFTYQITGEIGPDPIGQMSVNGWSAAPLDTSYVAGPDIAPTLVSRTPAGNVVAFTFAPGISPGFNSDKLVIWTPPEAIANTTASFIDGSVTQNVPTYTILVPEPTTVTLVGCGLLGLLALRRRK